MKLKQILHDVSYTLLLGNEDIFIDDICYDSRNVVKNCVFVCVKGKHEDGHRHIMEVIEKGAKAIIIDTVSSVSLEKIVELQKKVSVVLVENSQKALAYISATFFDYPATKCTVIGITGTKGKTTTSYMIKSILEAWGAVVGLIGTNGAFVKDEKISLSYTTPPSYEIQKLLHDMVRCGCNYIVMEVSSIGLKMNRVEGIPFDYGIFTNISEDHIGGEEHKDMEEYLYWKQSLFSQCNISIGNIDDSFCSYILSKSKGERIYYGLHHQCNSNACSNAYSYACSYAYSTGTNIEYITTTSGLGSVFTACYKDSIKEEQLPIHLTLAGECNIYNSLAAIACCIHIGCTKEAIQKGLSNFFVTGRMEVVESNDTFHLLIDYAHNANSLEQLLKTLASYHPKRIVCIFGCGGNRSKTRRYQMGEISGHFADVSIITEDNSRYEDVTQIINDILVGIKKTNGVYKVIPNRREAIEYSITHAEQGDVILLVGKGHEDYQEIKGKRTPFSEHAIVKEIMEKRKLGEIE